MHPALAEVIFAFRSVQDMAVSTLRDRMGIALPKSNVEWAKGYAEMGLEERGRMLGVEIRPHGYGVEMKFPDVSIDFDWGDEGEAYGFDGWRLWNFCKENRRFLDTMTYDLLKRRFERASADGELIGDRLLHYLADERRCFGAAR